MPPFNPAMIGAPSPVGRGENVAGVPLGGIVYARSLPDASYVACDGSFVPYPSKPGFPFPGTPGTSFINKITISGLSSTATIYDVAYGNGIYLVATDVGLYRSTDGNTYSVVSLPVGGAVYTASFSAGIFLFSMPDNIFRSSDGYTFNRVFERFTNLGSGYNSIQIFRFASDGADRWVGVGVNWNVVLLSQDKGLTWSLINYNSNNSGWRAANAVWWQKGNLFLMPGYDQDNNRSVVYRIDFVTGSARYQNNGFSNPDPGIVWGQAFVAAGKLIVGGNGNWYSKPDASEPLFSFGSGWGKVNQSFSTYATAYDGTMFYGTNTGNNSVSTDFVNWSSVAKYDNKNLDRVSVSNKRIFISGSSAYLLELVISSMVFKTPSVPALSLANGDNAVPYMKVA